MQKETQKIFSRLTAAAVALGLVCSVLAQNGSAAAYQDTLPAHSPAIGIVVVQPPETVAVSASAPDANFGAAVAPSLCQPLYVHGTNFVQQDVVFNLNQSGGCLQLSSEKIVEASNAKQISVAAQPAVTVTVKVSPGHYHKHAYTPSAPDVNPAAAAVPVPFLYYPESKMTLKVQIVKLTGAMADQIVPVTLAELQVYRC